MKYYIDGCVIRYSSDEKSGYVHKDFQCVELSEYEAWVADGNTAEEWQPDAVEPETTQPDMEEEI
jgi:hypothetical protein